MKTVKPKDIEAEFLVSKQLANLIDKYRAEITDKMPETVANFWEGHNFAINRVMECLKRSARRRRGIREASDQRVRKSQ